jgi:hydroxymethylpyrimidine/phosphomethylpyrimidine kinase
MTGTATGSSPASASGAADPPLPPAAKALPVALTIAGSDSSGGAGIQADLKTFSALGVYGASVLTALTAQNTRGVQGVHPVPVQFITAQMVSVLDDLSIGAVKTGMLGTAAIVEGVAAALAERARGVPLVVDPVMVATSGDVLLAPDAIEAVRRRLLPLAEVVTPNLPEAARLLDAPEARSDDDMVGQARAIARLGSAAVLIKGGHGEGRDAVDILLVGGPDGRIVRLTRPRIDTLNTHGTGCTLSAAIAAARARGLALDAAVAAAKEYLWQALAAGRALRLGGGHGPVHHLYAIDPPAIA